jgi:hypothetical protein
VSDAFYTSIAATASRLMGRFGATVTAKRSDAAFINPVTGRRLRGSVSQLSAKGIVQRYKDSLIDGTRILDSDRLLILDNSFEPLLSDIFVIQGQEWSVISIKSSQPANVPLVYFVQVRR